MNTHELIPIAVERTLDSLIGGLVLSGVAWTWLRVARRQNSASRFFILFILLIGIAVLPIVGWSWMGQASAASTTEAHSLLTLPEHVAEYLFLAWAAIAFAGLTRIAIGFLQFRKLQQSCVEVDPERLDERVRASLHESARPAILCASDRVSVPTALGLARPARIVIPSWLLDQISPDELHHLVLHELAHLRRWDDWSNLAQRILGALLFFHPAIWWLQRRLALEREMACDECVLAQTGNARAYAKSLAALAERSFMRRTVALAQAAVSRLHDTTLRVAKILSPTASRRSTSAVPLLASIAGIGALTLAVALFSPDLISFTESHASTSQAAAQPAAVNLGSVTPRAVMAAMPIAHPMRSRRRIQAVSPRPEPPVSLSAQLPRTTSPAFIPAKATFDRNVTVVHPAMLVVWQETYDDGSGLVIRQTYWRIVLLQNVTPKEQPQKTI